MTDTPQQHPQLRVLNVLGTDEIQSDYALNTENLRLLIDALEKSPPENFDMSEWDNFSLGVTGFYDVDHAERFLEEYPCGTAACIGDSPRLFLEYVLVFNGCP